MSTPIKLKKTDKSKLFTCNDTGKLDPNGMPIIEISYNYDVWEAVYNKLSYDIKKTDKLESYLRKSFRHYFDLVR